MNIAVIVGGPIGCYAGYLLAQGGHSVTIYENHPQIGCPIQCTGILTSDFDELGLPMDSYLVNTIKRIEVFTPSKSLAVTQKDYIVCRTRFDNFFADLAKNAGATVLVNHAFLRKERKTLIIKDSVGKTEKTITPDIVIAADGPLSPTAKAYGFFHPERESYYGIQAVVEGNFDSHTIKTYFGEEVCPGLFAWVVPESSTIARVGLATTKNTKHYFDKFMQEHNFTAQEIQAGTIPIYHPRQKLQQENCYVIGDASSYVKATTLGGLVPALKQARILAQCLLQGNNPQEYQKKIKPLQRTMKLHLQLHRIFDRFKDHDWDLLVHYLTTSGAGKALEEHTRENPFPIILKALWREPRLMRFVKYLW